MIFEKTNGHCHFCGDAVVLEKYGYRNINSSDGAWEIDHVVQKGKGGNKSPENCLPACVKCNRLRWHRKGDNIRNLMQLGLIANDEIKKGSEIGKTVKKLFDKRLENNKKRQRNNNF